MSFIYLDITKFNLDHSDFSPLEPFEVKCISKHKDVRPQLPRMLLSTGLSVLQTKGPK